MLCILTMMSMLTVNFSMVEAEEASEINFSSCRLLVGTNDSTIFADNDNILSAYNGVYLLKYSSAEETKLAYNDLLSKADFVNVDSSSFAVADDSIQNIESQAMSEDLNPISELAEADTTETKGDDIKKICFIFLPSQLPACQARCSVCLQCFLSRRCVSWSMDR